MRKRSLVAALLPLLCLAPACAPSEDDGEGSEAALTGNVRTIWKDLKELDRSGWTKLVGEQASDAIQDGLSSDRIKFDWDVKAAGSAKKNSSLPDMDVLDLDELSTGLLQKFGDSELPAQVNRIRRDRVNQDGSFFLDATTSVGLRGAKTWGVNGPSAGDFTSTIWFGFDAGASLESRIVAHAAKDTLTTQRKAWLQSILSAKDYFMNQAPEAVEKMAPGEMWGLRGKGRLGGHVGIGVPIVLAAPINLLFSVSGSAALEGNVDVQVMKLDNNQVVVDLGIEDGKVSGWSVGLGTTYGVPTVCRDSATGTNGSCIPDVGGMDMKDQIPKFAQKLLNSYLGVSASTGNTKRDSRLSVLRLRFDFNAKGEERKEMLAAFNRAIRFDARYAQTLNNISIDDAKRPVTVEADLFRSMSSSVRYTNWQAFGFRVYDKRDDKRTGAISLRTPTETKLVSFDVRNRRSGWFQTKHGFDRMAFASMSSKGGSEANFIMNLATSDKHLDARNLFTDNADAVLLTVNGRKASDALDPFANDLQKRVRACDDDNDGCILTALGGSPDLATAKDAFARALQAESQKVAGLAPTGWSDLAARAAQIRIVSQGLAFTDDSSDGPAVDFTYGVRLDDKGLNELMNPGRADDFKARAFDYLVTTTSIDRTELAPVGGLKKDDILKRLKGEAAPDALNDPKWPVYKDLVNELAGVFVKQATAYQQLSGTDAAARQAMQSAYGDRYVPVFIGLHADQLKDIARAHSANEKTVQAAFSSLAHQRSTKAVELFDELYKAAKGDLHRSTHLWPEHLVGYTMAQMVKPENRESSLDARVSGKVIGRFDAAGLNTWNGPPTVAGKVSRITVNSLDLEALPKD